MEPLTRIQSSTVALPVHDIDTDQIIPARFLTATSKEGFGKLLFHDLRYNEDGSPKPDFVINTPAAESARVLVAGNNFGCGSSREHAPWALTDFGFQAVISTEFADIFRNNSLKNGLLPIVVDADIRDWLIENAGTEVTVDVAASTLTLSDGRVVSYPIEPFARHCLLEGIDQLGFLRQQADAITDFEKNRSWTP